MQDLAIPDLWPGQGRKRARMESNAAEAPAVAAEAAPDEGLLAPDEECSVCLNAFERPTITPCSHWFCRYASTEGQPVLLAPMLVWGITNAHLMLDRNLLDTEFAWCTTAHAKSASCRICRGSLVTAPQSS